MKRVIIEKTDTSLRIWHHGVLVHNYHGMSYELIKSEMSPFTIPILSYIFNEDWQLRDDLLKQLEEEGYFNKKEE